MSKVFITGSSDGLGFMAGRRLVEQGHRVVLHARNETRAAETQAALPKTEAVVIGDVSTLKAMRDVAEQATALGPFDAVIHNVGLGYREAKRVETADGLSQLWAVNVLAPYVLTALMEKPKRLIYLSSGMSSGGNSSLNDIQWSSRPWNGSQAYADTKFQDLLLTFGVARRWPNVLSNAVSPGWVPTRMGGAAAPDDLAQGSVTQAWLAVSDDAAAQVSGGYFYHQQPTDTKEAARDAELQDELLEYCQELSGVALT